MGKGQNININRGLEEVDSNPQGWLWSVETSGKKVIAVVVETARELELETEPENVTMSIHSHILLLQSHDKT